MPLEDRHTRDGKRGAEEVREAPPISEVASGDEVFEMLKKNLTYATDEYVVLVARELDARPFAVLAATVLSQNTSDKNSIRAYKRLREVVGVRPEDIARAELDVIEEAIKPAGLARQKARTLKLLAERVMALGGEQELLRMDPWRLREELLKVPGVGPKTVDVFLSVYGLAPVFAVDTHARRIAVRWGLAKPNARYEEVSRALLEFFGPERAEEAHRLLIALGRRYCTSRNPRCRECPLRGICPWPRLSSRQSRGGVRGRRRKP